MREPAHPTRTTLLVAVALALLLVLAYAITSHADRSEPAPPAPAPTGATTVAPSPTVPRPTRATPVRSLGSLQGRSVITSGHGTLVLRYARARGNATRVHLICTGCDADTWLVELPRGEPVAASGPLPEPADATGVADTVDGQGRSDLLVEASAGSDWSVTLTPFDEIPVHRQSFDALDDDVVAVRADAGLTLTCGGAYAYRTFGRGTGAREYGPLEAGGGPGAGVVTLRPGRGTDRLVLAVACPGRWSVTVP